MCPGPTEGRGGLVGAAAGRPILEVLLNGAYYWVPFERISSVTVEPPGDARDLVWLPAEFRWSNGGEAMGLIPVRYPGSESSEDPAIRLARKTAWQAAGPDAFTGVAARTGHLGGERKPPWRRDTG